MANTRLFESGRFGYAMGYKTRTAAEDAFDRMCNEGEMSPCEGRVEPYDAGNGGHAKRVSRWAVTTI